MNALLRKLNKIEGWQFTAKMTDGECVISGYNGRQGVKFRTTGPTIATANNHIVRVVKEVTARLR